MKEIRVMRGFLPYFHLLKVYNVENFRNSSRQIYQNISRVIFMLSYYVSDVIYMALLYWKYIEKDNNMDPLPLSLFLILLQMKGTHLSGIRNNRLISNTLRRLQNAIEGR